MKKTSRIQFSSKPVGYSIFSSTGKGNANWATFIIYKSKSEAWNHWFKIYPYEAKNLVDFINDRQGVNWKCLPVYVKGPRKFLGNA